MDPKDYRMLMFGLLSVAMNRDKHAHRNSIEELAKLCPDAEGSLQNVHKLYCNVLNEELEQARQLIESPFVDEEGGTDDPGWRLLVYLTREGPLSPDHLADVRISNAVRQTFGQPTVDLIEND